MKLDNVFELVKHGDCTGWRHNQFVPTFGYRTDFTQADITAGKIVYYNNELSAYKQFKGTSPSGRAYIYYIPYDNVILTESQFIDYAINHPADKYLLTPDNATDKTETFAYIENPVNNVHVWLYNDYDRKGKLNLVAELWNKPHVIEWSYNKIHSNNVKKIVTTTSGYPATKKVAIQYENWATEDGTLYQPNVVTDWGLLSPCNTNNSNQLDLDSSEIMDQYLQIPGVTRIVITKDSDDVAWKIGNDARATGSLVEKYGMDRDNNGCGYYYNHDEYYCKDDFFPDADLDSATYDRVVNYINECLENNRGTKRCIRNNIAIQEKRVLVISEPVARHRRPTYHCIVGVKINDAIDVVELIRGELLMKDMTPATAYWLDRKTGKYARMSYGLYSYCKDFVTDESRVELDSVSLAAWTEEKSLHPELIKTAIEYGADKELGLNKLKIFNRLQFGALFSEQLFKAGKADIAEMLAEYIVCHADKPGVRCNNLSDILPECNPEGTSVMKVFNMTKPAHDLFWEILDTGARNNMDEFVSAYKTIHRFIPDGIVTSERKKFIEQYYALRRTGWDSFWLQSRRERVSILDYPDLIKPIYKMTNKLRALGYDATRKYQEIVTAYLTFLEYGIKPEDNLIFIEFGTNGPEDEVIKMIGDREHAANVALETHQAKLDEIERQRLEDKYAYRKAHVIAELESDKKLQKDPAFKGYTVIAPSQLYGEDVVGSIEKEGADMHHCVYRQYTKDIANGSYTVMYLRYDCAPETSLVTIGIDNTGRINQTYGHNDNPIDDQQAAAIAAWAKSKEGLVTFNSEHANVRPGGWPMYAPIPALGALKSGWLEKLAKIEK